MKSYVCISYGKKNGAVAMSEWQDMKSAPEDRLILLDVGFPWAVVGIWNTHEQQWCYPNIQCNCINGGWTDPYFENEYENVGDVKGWMPLPECHQVQRRPR